MVGSEEVTNDNWKGVVPSLTSIKGVQEHNPNNVEAIPCLKLVKKWLITDRKLSRSPARHHTIKRSAFAERLSDRCIY